MPSKKQNLLYTGTQVRKANAGTFRKGDGRPRPKGRVKGRPNKVTMMLRDAILLAADDLGEDGKGTDGMRGWLRWLAKRHPDLYTPLMAKVLPIQVSVDAAKPRKMTLEEMAREARERGYPVRPIMSLVGPTNGQGPVVLDNDDYEEELNGRGPMNGYDEDEPADDDAGEPIGGHTR